VVVIVGEQQISGIRQLSACHPPCALKTKFNDDLLSCAAIRTLRGASFRRFGRGHDEPMCPAEIAPGQAYVRGVRPLA